MNDEDSKLGIIEETITEKLDETNNTSALLETKPKKSTVKKGAIKAATQKEPALKEDGLVNQEPKEGTAGEKPKKNASIKEAEEADKKDKKSKKDKKTKELALKGPLCKLVKKDYLAKNLKEYKELVRKPAYICKKCGRVAKDKKFLCKPVSID